MAISTEVMDAVVAALVAESDEDIALADVTTDWLLKSDFGLDSMHYLSLLMDLEDEYGIEMSEDAVSQLHTVGDLVRVIEKNRAADT